MQFSHALRALPVVLCCASPLASQARFRVLNDGEWFYQEAGGRRLARLARGAVVSGAVGAVGAAGQGDWMRVTIEGWIFATSVGPTTRPGFDLAVTRAPDENLRSAPAGALVARLAEGFALSKIGQDGSWVRVQREGWVQRAALAPIADVAATRTTPADTGASQGGLTPSPRPGDSTPATPADLSRVQPMRATPLFRAPEGPEAGSIAPETPLRVLGRSGEWTRVQFEGWVKSADLQVAPPGVLVGVSAAELRADPARYAGKVLRWTLQFISVQTADDLRPDIPAGATYLLARGPLPERGFVYVVVPAVRRDAVETLTPLATIEISARVRAGRSRYLGNPVVELLSLETRE